MMYHKSFIIGIVLVFLPVILAAKQTPIEKLIQKYDGKPGFTTVSVSKDMINMLSSMKEKDSTADDMGMSMLKDVDGLLVLTYDHNKESKLLPADFYEDVTKIIPLGEYKNIMSVNNDGEKVNFFVKNDKQGKVNEFLMLVLDKNEVVVIWISGSMNLSDLSNLSKIMQLPALQGLNGKGNKNKPQKPEKPAKPDKPEKPYKSDKADKAENPVD